MFNFFKELVEDASCKEEFSSFNIVNMSNKIVYVEGIKKVMSISSSLITVKVKGYVVKIVGNELVIKKITSNTLLVKGEILSVECVWCISLLFQR